MRTARTTVTDVVRAVAVLGLVAVLGACSDGTVTTAPTTGAPSTSATSATPTTETATTSTSTATTSATTTTTTAPTTTSTTATPSTPVATTTAIVADQRTPEAAMTTWLNAMVRGDAVMVCSVQAIDGAPIAGVEEAITICANGVKPTLNQLKAVASEFKGISIKGATITGTTASFDKATVTPQIVKQVMTEFLAVKIGDKWYVSEKPEPATTTAPAATKAATSAATPAGNQ